MSEPSPTIPTGHALWQKAATFAATYHQGQSRKGKNPFDDEQRTPYIAHPFRVTMTIRCVFGCDDPIILAAALLHDTIEDTSADYDDLLEHFGSEVADLVATLTKDQRMPEGAREQAYHDQLAAGSWKARMIKLADVYDNVNDCASLSEAKQVKAVGKAKQAIAISEGDAELETAIASVAALLSAK